MSTDNTPDITLFFQSPDLDRPDIEYAVTVPTFRRPRHLRDTLTSIAKQDFNRPHAVIVMENDAEGLEGARAAAAFFSENSLPGLVIIAHNRGNCHAYNAGWAVALNTFPALEAIAVIDDDERAVPEWLTNLVQSRERFDVEIIGAPQVPVFESDVEKKWSRHPVFAPPYEQSGPVPILYSSGNVLISRSFLETMPEPFLDPLFNFIGGGDSDFYHRARERGARFAWCAEAPVHETIPNRRIEPSWLRARARREGALSAIIEKRIKPGVGHHLGIIAKSVALLGLSPLRSLRLWLRTGSPEIGLYCMQAAIGRFVAEFGQVNEQYRNPDKN